MTATTNREEIEGLVSQLETVVKRLSPLVRQGEDRIWRPASAAIPVASSAAQALTALLAENERLRDALEKIELVSDEPPFRLCQRLASAALNKDPDQ